MLRTPERVHAHKDGIIDHPHPHHPHKESSSSSSSSFLTELFTLTHGVDVSNLLQQLERTDRIPAHRPPDVVSHSHRVSTKPTASGGGGSGTGGSDESKLKAIIDQLKLTLKDSHTQGQGPKLLPEDARSYLVEALARLRHGTPSIDHDEKNSNNTHSNNTHSNLSHHQDHNNDNHNNIHNNSRNDNDNHGMEIQRNATTMSSSAVMTRGGPPRSPSELIKPSFHPSRLTTFRPGPSTSSGPSSGNHHDSKSDPHLGSSPGTGAVNQLNPLIQLKKTIRGSDTHTRDAPVAPKLGTKDLIAQARLRLRPVIVTSTTMGLSQPTKHTATSTIETKGVEQGKSVEQDRDITSSSITSGNVSISVSMPLPLSMSLPSDKTNHGHLRSRTYSMEQEFSPVTPAAAAAGGGSSTSSSSVPPWPPGKLIHMLPHILYTLIHTYTSI